MFHELLSNGRSQDFVWRGFDARKPLVFGLAFFQLRIDNSLVLFIPQSMSQKSCDIPSVSQRPKNRVYFRRGA